MVCPASSYTGVRTDNLRWSNWSGRVSRTLASFFTPVSFPPSPVDTPLPPPLGLQQLVKVVQDATSANRSLHAIGSGWAFDDQAIGDDWTIDIARLRSRLMSSVGEALVPSSPANAAAGGPALTDEWRQRQADRGGSRKLVHVEAGIKLWQLISALDAAGLALPTLGGANGQALAGVVNTSVHGGDWQQGAFPAIVRAVHLVTHGGREIWIEPQRAPVTADARLRPTLACASAEIMRSDEVFDAVLVGLGRFGVVYSYVIEVRPQFWVAEVATRLTKAATFAALRAGAANPGAPFAGIIALMGQDPGPPAIAESRSGRPASFFQLLANTRNPPSLWAQRKWESDIHSDLNLDPAADASGDLVALGLNAAFALGWNNPANAIVDGIVNSVFDGQMNTSATKGKRARHAWVTAGPPNGRFAAYRGVSMEVMFDANDAAYVDFLEAAINAGPAFKQVGWISLRPCVSTRATLSMHNVPGSHAVSIEIALINGLPDNEAYLDMLQQKAIASRGRLHWGQANNRLTSQIVAAQYGSQLGSWRRALRAVSGGSTVFSNAFTRQRGLEPTFEIAAAVAPGGPIRLDTGVTLTVTARDVGTGDALNGAPVLVDQKQVGTTGTPFTTRFSGKYRRQTTIDPRTHERTGRWVLVAPVISVTMAGYVGGTVVATFTGGTPPPEPDL